MERKTHWVAFAPSKRTKGEGSITALNYARKNASYLGASAGKKKKEENRDLIPLHPGGKKEKGGRTQ